MLTVSVENFQDDVFLRHSYSIRSIFYMQSEFLKGAYVMNCFEVRWSFGFSLNAFSFKVYNLTVMTVMS